MELSAIWKNAPNPMLVFVKKMDITPLIRASRKKHLKLNMLLDYCIGEAALEQKDVDTTVTVNGGSVNTHLANRFLVCSNTWKIGECVYKALDIKRKRPYQFLDEALLP